MKSHRQIFRSSAIIGGSSVINLVISIVKVKVLAVLLGPAGIGLMGIYQNIMTMASTLSGCGMADSGVRQLAASAGEQATLIVVRRALFLANLMLGLFGFLMLWLFREPVAVLVFGDTTYVNDVGWLGLGVFFTLVAGSQTALFQGLRRIGDLARVQIAGALIGAPIGIFLVYLYGYDGVLWFVLTAPIISVLVAMFYARQLPRPKGAYDWPVIQQQWQAMIRLGIPFMAAGLLTLATQLAARSIILQELGIEASGYFQASWAISMTYIGFVLGAMTADYYPRLTEVITDHQRARKLINEQTEMALLLAGPVVLMMLTLTSWVIILLYSKDFSPTIELLRWQMLGDIFKIICWPLGFSLLASGRGGVFFCTQLLWNMIYIGIIVWGINQWGLVVAGAGFLVAYMILYGAQLSIAIKFINYRAVRRNLIFSFFLLLSGAGILYMSKSSILMTYVFGILVSLIVIIYSLRRLNHLMDLNGWFKKRFKNA